MATVYFGYSADGRPAAVKVMHAELTGHPGARERFRREVAATRSAGGYGPAVVDADPEAARPWLATEFLAGVTLREAVALAGPLPATSAWPVVVWLAQALRAIHRAGIVHLDVSPANLMLTPGGPRLIDFGIAGRLGPDGVAPSDGTAGARPVMSPEQLAGAPVGPASDVYSMGATLLYACTGATPADDRPGRPESIGDPALRALVTRCLRPDPAERPTSAALAEELPAVAPQHPGGLPGAVVAEIYRRAVQQPPPVPRRPLGRRELVVGGIGGLVVGGAVATGLYVSRSGVPADDRAVPAPRHTRSASPSPPPSPPSRRLEFQFSGSARLLSLTLTVNGTTTTVRDPAMPYQVTVAVPALPAKAAWSLTFTRTGGEIDYRVLVDGIQVASGVAGGNDTHTDSDQGET
jgi:serine/threonine protein kinase